MKTYIERSFIRINKSVVFCFLLLNMLFSLSLSAATITVNSIAALQNACDNSIADLGVNTFPVSSFVKYTRPIKII